MLLGQEIAARNCKTPAIMALDLARLILITELILPREVSFKK